MNVKGNQRAQIWWRFLRIPHDLPQTKHRTFTVWDFLLMVSSFFHLCSLFITLWPRVLQIYCVLCEKVIPPALGWLCGGTTVVKNKSCNVLILHLSKVLIFTFQYGLVTFYMEQKEFNGLGILFLFNEPVPYTLIQKRLHAVTDLSSVLLLLLCFCCSTESSPRCHGVCAASYFKMLLLNWFFTATMEKISTLFQTVAWQTPRAGQESHRSKQTGFHTS